MKTRVFDIRNPRTRRLEWCNSGKTKSSLLELKPLFGKPYSTIKSSKFCPSAIINVLQGVCDLLDDYSSGDSNDAKKCQCTYDWPRLEDTNLRQSKRLRLMKTESKSKKSSSPTKCVCYISPKRKMTRNLKYYTHRKRLSAMVREILGSHGEKQRITTNDLYNRILEEYPEMSTKTEVFRFQMKESMGDATTSNLIARRYLDTCVSPIAFKALVKGCILSLQHIKRGEDMLVVNFPLLTRLYVGLLHIIGIIKVLNGTKWHLTIIRLFSGKYLGKILDKTPRSPPPLIWQIIYH